MTPRPEAGFGLLYEPMRAVLQIAGPREITRLNAQINTLAHPVVPPIPPVTPRRMPAVRDRAAQVWDDINDDDVAEAAPAFGQASAAARALRMAEMFWVAESMAALVDGAYDTLPGDTSPARSLQPAECGFLVFAAAFVLPPEPGDETRALTEQPMPVRAVSWRPGGLGLDVVLWTDVRAVAQGMAREQVANAAERPVAFGDHASRAARDAQQAWYTDHGVASLVTRVGALFPLLASSYALTGTVDEIASAAGRVLLARLLTTWLLMSQPLLTDRTRLPADPNVARKYRRAQRPDPDVTIIDLRHVKTPDDGQDVADRPTRTYTRRWVVRGHWRNQAYGPGRALRRPVFVPAYIKGPDGAPLRVTEHVNVWRR